MVKKNSKRSGIKKTFRPKTGKASSKKKAQTRIDRAYNVLTKTLKEMEE